MSDSLTQTQIMGLTTCSIWGGLSLLSGMGNQLGHHIWLATLTAGAIGAAVYWLLSRWLDSNAARRLGANGPGPLLAGAGMLYVLLLTAMITAAAVELWCVWAGEGASFSLYALLFTLVILYGGLLRGYILPARLSIIFITLLTIMVVADSILLLPMMRPQRLLPLMGGDLAAFARSGIMHTVILLAGLPLLMFLLPRAENIAAAKTGLRRGLLLGLSYAVLMEARNVLLLGDLLMLEHYPLLRALKMAEAGIGISRIDFMGILLLIAVAAISGMTTISVGQICWQHLFKEQKRVKKANAKQENGG